MSGPDLEAVSRFVAFWHAYCLFERYLGGSRYCDRGSNAAVETAAKSVLSKRRSLS